MHLLLVAMDLATSSLVASMQTSFVSLHEARPRDSGLRSSDWTSHANQAQRTTKLRSRGPLFVRKMLYVFAIYSNLLLFLLVFGGFEGG